MPKDEKVRNPKNVPLVSCHADGHVRIWDHHTGTMEQEFDGRNGSDEGMTCMTTDPEATLLIVGGSKGSVRVSATAYHVFCLTSLGL